MSDSISKERRSWNMAQIKNKDTKIEVEVRKYLFAEGFRFRKNDKRLPGKPDVVLPKYKTVIFVNGCFWHHHEGCKNATVPKTRTDFWMNKFEKNIQNDQDKIAALHELGWQVLVLWECELEKDFIATMDHSIELIKSNTQ